MDFAVNTRSKDRVALWTEGGCTQLFSFFFFVAKHRLQFLEKLVLEFRTLVKMQYYGWSKHQEYSFNKTTSYYCDSLLHIFNRYQYDISSE